MAVSEGDKSESRPPAHRRDVVRSLETIPVKDLPSVCCCWRRLVGPPPLRRRQALATAR